MKLSVDFAGAVVGNGASNQNQYRLSGTDGGYLPECPVRAGGGTDSFGVEVNGCCGKMKVEFHSEEVGTTWADLTAVGFRGFYNLVKRENSVFYAGLEYTAGSVDIGAHRDILDDCIAMYGAFVGRSSGSARCRNSGSILISGTGGPITATTT